MNLKNIIVLAVMLSLSSTPVLAEFEFHTGFSKKRKGQEQATPKRIANEAR
jgi:hypothetical protein